MYTPKKMVIAAGSDQDKELFDVAYENLSRLEGGWADDPDDQPTNYGITLPWLKNIYPDADLEDLKNLSPQEAKDLFFVYRWIPTRYREIASGRLVSLVFSLDVHSGARPAVRVLQRAVNRLSGEEYLKVDGWFGDKTSRAVEDRLRSSGHSSLIMSFRREARAFYFAVVGRKPEKRKFLAGWLNRLD